MVRAVTFESCETLTQEEFAAWIERFARDDFEYELLNGRIVVTPPSGWPEGEGEAAVLAVVRRFVRERGLGRVLGPSQGFELPSGDTVAPDCAFVSSGSWATTNPVPGKFLRVVPDLLVEVVSPHKLSRDRGEKKVIYERNGVREYWIVDDRKREITRLVLRGERFEGGTVFADGEMFVSEVLAGFNVPVAELLPEPA